MLSFSPFLGRKKEGKKGKERKGRIKTGGGREEGGKKPQPSNISKISDDNLSLKTRIKK